MMRRDLCLGCRNYRLSFGRTALFKWSFIRGSVGGDLYEENNLVAPIDEDSIFNRPTWISGTVTLHGRAIKTYALFDGWDFHLQQTWLRIEWWSGGAYRLVTRLPNVAPGNCAGFTGFHAYSEIIFQDESFWGGPLTPLGCEVGWQPWP